MPTSACLFVKSVRPSLVLQWWRIDAMFDAMEGVEGGVCGVRVKERSRLVYVLFPWWWVLVFIMAVWVWRSVYSCVEVAGLAQVW